MVTRTNNPQLKIKDTPVILRVGKNDPDKEPVAVFVTHRAYKQEDEMETFSFRDGWGSCTHEWFDNESRLAKEKESAKLRDYVMVMGFWRTTFYERRTKVHKRVFEAYDTETDGLTEN